MAYFDERKNVEDYIKMAEGYDGRELIAVLKKYLLAGSTVLELGMGPRNISLTFSASISPPWSVESV